MFFYKTRNMILVIILVSFIVSLFYAQRGLDNISQPPIFNNSDQLDYNNMAYSMMKNNIPAIYITKEYKKPFKEYKNKYPDNKFINRVLSMKNEGLRLFTYRPLLYPLVLGISYKIFGYNFFVARILNVVLSTLGAVLLFLIIRKLTNDWIAFGASFIFIVLPNITQYANQLMSEIFVVTMLISFLFILQKSFKDTLKRYWLLTGLFMGLLVLAKQMFLLISLPLVLGIGIYCIKREQIKTFYYFLAPYLLIVALWMTYNVAVTKTWELKTGTSGWHDMPSAYSTRYISGENRYKVREEIFKTYEIENNISIKGDIKRALYGKIIFQDMVKDVNFWFNLPKFIYYKLYTALVSNYYTYLIFFIISLLTFMYLFIFKKLTIFMLSIIIIAYSNLVIVALTFSAHGRLLVSSLPVFIILSAVLVYNVNLNFNIKQRKYSRKKLRS